MKTMLLTVTALVFSASTFAQKNETPGIIKTFPIGGDASGWDYLAINTSNNLLYVSHGMQVEVLNKTNGKTVTAITGTTGVHGIAFDENQNKGFITCSKLNAVKVFDIATNQTIATIATGENPRRDFLSTVFQEDGSLQWKK